MKIFSKKINGLVCGALIILSGAVAAGENSSQSPDEFIDTYSSISFPEAYPDPRHHNIKLEKSVLVPMRDGIRLSTDIYSPKGITKPLPVILIRTPYNKNRFRDQEKGPVIALFFAAQGYVVAVQDVRGRYESEGEYLVSAADRKDGYDAIEWLSSQPWSSGKIGTYGCSYLGENQIQLAAERHPNHLAAIPQAAAGSYRGNYRQFGYFDGGVFDLKSGLPWFWYAGQKDRIKRPPEMSDQQYRRQSGQFAHYPEPSQLNTAEAFNYLPVVDIIKHFGGPRTDFENMVSHSPADPYWQRHHYVDDNDAFNVPALHVNSWFDYGATDTLALFNLFRSNAKSQRARDNQFAIISPFGHCASEAAMSEKSAVGDRDMGDTRLTYYQIYLNWFDYWLKDIANGVTDMPKVRYFLMGANQWRSASQWPLPETRYQKFYLHSDGSANRSLSSGMLKLEPAHGKQLTDNYIYDPAAPVPSLGGTDGAFDQTALEQRQDVLVYSTAPLDKTVEVTGPIKVVLYVSSSARDTDFTAKLVDVYPDGRAFNVQEGILRARYRNGYNKTVLMTEDQVYELHIDLHDTSNLFNAGHRIRLDISSSNFPRFVRNLNTGGNNYDEKEWVTAKNIIHHSSKYPSYIELPIQSQISRLGKSIQEQTYKKAGR